jgi:hypothetical protein
MSVCLFRYTSLYLQRLMELTISDHSLGEEWKCGLDMCVCVCVWRGGGGCLENGCCNLCFNGVISTYFAPSVVMKSLFCVCCADICLCAFMLTNIVFHKENRLTKQVETTWVTLKLFEMSIINLRLMREHYEGVYVSFGWISNRHYMGLTGKVLTFSYFNIFILFKCCDIFILIFYFHILIF